ncbi:MAG: hypothetical protein LLG00_00840 [Planctomycetaceae bacterium]|nr:hypothetical protein [Planctomycetaceae bacterium]
MRISPLTSLLLTTAMAATVAAATPPPIDDARAAAAGVRKIVGRRLTLYTDVGGTEIDQLPAVFEQAFSQWCRYFGVDESKHADQRLTGCLMKDRDRFVASGLLPPEVPVAKGRAYTWFDRFWVDEQPTEWYRRELLLHEGTHAFMYALLGDCGPPWYMEGMAEYLGTHRWQDGRLTLGYVPRSREESPRWGRIPTIQKLVAKHQASTLRSIIEYSADAHRQAEPYAWCWAAAMLLDRHPRYQERFRQLIGDIGQPDFNDRFYRLFEPDWQPLCEEWQLLVTGIEYGYDVPRVAVDFAPAKQRPAAKSPRTVAVAADRGWQNSGLRLDAGKRYRLAATGRYQVAKEPKIWWCEPGGVSIRYYHGQPLGVLLAAVRPDHPTSGSLSALVCPTVIGLGTTLSPKETGTLFLKINDSAGELADNAGELSVRVSLE